MAELLSKREYIRLAELDTAEKRGVEQGIEQNKEETVIRMYEEGLDLDLIQKVVDLDLKHIQEIISNQEKR